MEQWELLKRVCEPRPGVANGYKGMSDEQWKLFAAAIRAARRGGNIGGEHEWVLAGMLDGEAPDVKREKHLPEKRRAG